MKTLARFALWSAISTFGVASSGPASAASTLGLVWHSTGSPTVTIDNGSDQVLRADVVATGDVAGIVGIFVSFRFDADLGDEVDIATAAEAGCPTCPAGGGTEEQITLPGPSNSMTNIQDGYVRNQVESTASSAGLLGGFDSLTAVGTGIVSSTVTIGSVWFRTNAANIASDGVDIEVVILDDAVDAVINTAGDDISDTVVLNGASINLAPSLAVPAWSWLAGGLALVSGAGLHLRQRARRVER